MNSLRQFLKRVLRRKSAHEQMFRTPRCWSNAELRQFGHLFHGSAINVSAWEDKDKQGGNYRDYFPNVTDYFISNYGTSQGTIQGSANEIFIDLSTDLPPHLNGRFDIVFNHTTLEHIYDFRTAFGNLCALSRDIVIVVVPWLQAMHADYGDYWRFSPQAVAKMFSDANFEVLHLSWTDQPASAVYVFAVATRKAADWVGHFPQVPFPRPGTPEFLHLPANPPGSRIFTT